MPNYFYVKSGGTRGTSDTPYTTQQTGSFASLGASNYYDNIDEVFDVTTTPPATGDFILVSDQHSHTYSATANYNGGSSVGAELIFISVDDTACDQYKRGAYEEAKGVNLDINIGGRNLFLGLDLHADNDITVNIVESSVTLYDCTTKVTAFGDIPFRITSRSKAIAIGCTFNWNDVGNVAPISIATDSRVEFHYCTFATNSSYAGYVFSLDPASPNIVLFRGCDFSGLSSTYMLADSVFDAHGDEFNDVVFENCKLPSTLTNFIDGFVGSTLTKVWATNSSDTSGAQEYQYYYESRGGRVDEDTAKYRDASQPFPSGQKVSLKCVTDANAGEWQPFVFDLPARYAKLSDTASDTIRIYLTCANTLDNADVYAEVIYQDGTNQHTPNQKASIGEYLVPGDFRVTAPVALSTATGSWTGGLTNLYYIDLDTSTDAGADGYPIIRVYVAKASETIYFDSEVEIRG